MSDQPPPNGTPGPQQGMPPMIVNAQYVKDLSFEVPGAPDIFATMQEQPRGDVALDIEVRQLGGPARIFEVSLKVRVDARVRDTAAFIAEITYCGIVTLNLPQDAEELAIFIETPRLLFPFVRNIIADLTRESGFAPVVLQPVDFVSLWQARRVQPPGGAPEGTLLA